MTHIPIKNSAPRASSCHELQSNKLQQMVGIDKFSPCGNHTCNFIYEILKMINNFEKLHMHASLWARSKGHLGWGKKCIPRHVGFKISSVHWKKKSQNSFQAKSWQTTPPIQSSTIGSSHVCTIHRTHHIGSYPSTSSSCNNLMKRDIRSTTLKVCLTY